MAGRQSSTGTAALRGAPSRLDCPSDNPVFGTCFIVIYFAGLARPRYQYKQLLAASYSLQSEHNHGGFQMATDAGFVV